MAKGAERELSIKIGAKVDNSVNTATSSVSKKINDIEKSTSRLSSKMNNPFGSGIAGAEKQFSSLQSMASKAAKGIAGAFAAVKIGQFVKGYAEDAISQSIEFQKTMAGVVKVVDGLKNDDGSYTDMFYNMKNSIEELSTQIPMTVNEIGEIISSAGQANIESDELLRFAETASKMGIAFDSTAEDAGNWMATWRTSMSLTQDEVEDMADQINYLGNTSSEDALKLSEVVTRVGALGKMAGLSGGEVAALAASMPGVKAEISATGIKNMTKAMTAGTSATKKQKKALKTLGFDASQLAKNMQKDATGSIISFMTAVNKLPKEKQSSILTDYFGSESVASISQLVGNIENMKDQIHKVGDATQYAGSMEKEFLSASDTTENKLKLMENRIDKNKRRLAENFLPIIDEGTKIFANLSDRVTENLMKVMPRIENSAQYILDNSDKIIEKIRIASKIGATMFVGSKMFSAGTKAVSVIKDIVKVAPLIGQVLIPTVTSPIGAIVALGSAMLGVQLIMEKFHKKAVNNNLAKHFGNISLTMEDIEKAAVYIVNNKNLEKFNTMMTEKDKIKEYGTAVSEAAKEIEKLNWKVSIGMKLTESDKESYISNISSYISNIQSQINSEHYKVSLAVSIMTPDDDNGEVIRNSVNEFYMRYQNELSEIGNQLQDAVNKAFEDGLLDFDEEKKIAELQEKMAKIQSELTISNFEGKLAGIGIDFSGKSLTKESYDELNTAIEEKVNEAVNGAKESYEIAMGAAELRFRKEGDTKEYKTAKGTHKQKYFENIGEILLRSANFKRDTLLEAYGGDLPQLTGAFQEAINVQAERMVTVGEFNLTNMSDDIAQSLNMDAKTKGAISNLFKQMKPDQQQMIELANEYKEAGKSVPDSLAEGIANSAVIGAIAGDVDSLAILIGGQFSKSPEWQNSINKMKDEGFRISNSIMEGMKLRIGKASGKTGDLFGDIQLPNKLYKGNGVAIETIITGKETVAKDVEEVQRNIDSLPTEKIVEVDITDNATPQLNEIRRKFATLINDGYFSVGPIQQNATGTTNAEDVFIGGEKGVEIVKPKSGNPFLIGVNGAELVTGYGGATVYDNETTMQMLYENSKNTVTPMQEALNTMDNVSQNHKSSSSNNTSTNGDGMPNIVYSPTYTIQGGASEEDITNTKRRDYQEFVDMIDRYFKDRKRKEFA